MKTLDPITLRRVTAEIRDELKKLDDLIEQKDLDQLPITSDPEIVSGAPVFRGTRVPVDALLNNLEAGLTLDEFLDNFPTVSREQGRCRF